MSGDANPAAQPKPGPKPWSSRFDEATDELVEAYTSSVHTDAMFVAPTHPRKQVKCFTDVGEADHDKASRAE